MHYSLANVKYYITVLYGLKKEVDFFKTVKILKDFGLIKIKIDKIDKFEADDYDVLVYKIISPKLEELHTFLKETFANDFSYPIYSPHLTLAYIQKGKGDFLLGDTKWSGEEYIFNTIYWSHTNGFELPITLI